MIFFIQTLCPRHLAVLDIVWIHPHQSLIWTREQPVLCQKLFLAPFPRKAEWSSAQGQLCAEPCCCSRTQRYNAELSAFRSVSWGKVGSKHTAPCLCFYLLLLLIPESSGSHSTMSDWYLNRCSPVNPLSGISFDTKSRPGYRLESKMKMQTPASNLVRVALNLLNQ